MFEQDEYFFSPDEQSPDGIRTFRIPPGSPSINTIIANNKTLSHLKPTFVFLKTDALKRNFVRDFSSLGCPSLVSVADTHHLYRPIEVVIDYLRQEEFTYISAENDRHHLKWFKRAGFHNLLWLPNLALTPRQIQPKLQQTKDNMICFIGSVGKFHPFRTYLVDLLASKLKDNFIFKVASQDEASFIYNRSLISINISLNCDLNWRFFEILAAGGFLLSDRLPKQSGIDTLFIEGYHYEAYSTEQELLSKIHYYRSNPQHASIIAQRGYKQFWLNSSSTIIRKQLFKHIYLNRRDQNYIYPFPSKVNNFSPDCLLYLRAYQSLQEIHRLNTHIFVVHDNDIPSGLLFDLKDFSRLVLIPYTDIVSIDENNLLFGQHPSYVLLLSSLHNWRQLLQQDLFNGMHFDFVVSVKSDYIDHISLNQQTLSYDYEPSINCMKAI